MTTPTRKLEETFRQILAAALPNVSVRAAHEDTDSSLPNIEIFASSRGTADSIKVGEECAEEIDLRVACYVDAFTSNASQLIEVLAEQVRTTIEAAVVTGWRLLILNYESLTREANDNIRAITLTWRVFALTQD